MDNILNWYISFAHCWVWYVKTVLKYEDDWKYLNVFNIIKCTPLHLFLQDLKEYLIYICQALARPSSSNYPESFPEGPFWNAKTLPKKSAGNATYLQMHCVDLL